MLHWAARNVSILGSSVSLSGVNRVFAGERLPRWGWVCSRRASDPLENGKPPATAGRKTSGLAWRGSGAVDGVQVMRDVRWDSIVWDRGLRYRGVGRHARDRFPHAAPDRSRFGRFAGALKIVLSLPPQKLAEQFRTGRQSPDRAAPPPSRIGRSVHFARRWSPRPS
jgi:hypothetical protein